LGPPLFTIYLSPVASVTFPFDVRQQQYDYDTQLSHEKSDAIVLGTHSRNRTISSVRNVDVFGSSVSLSDSVKLSGVTFDSNLTFRQHVNLVSQSCFHHIKALRHMRHSLDSQTASLVAHALTTSRLDYADAVLFSSAITVLNVLQRVQNSPAGGVL